MLISFWYILLMCNYLEILIFRKIGDFSACGRFVVMGVVYACVLFVNLRRATDWQNTEKLATSDIKNRNPTKMRPIEADISAHLRLKQFITGMFFSAPPPPRHTHHHPTPAIFPKTKKAPSYSLFNACKYLNFSAKMETQSLRGENFTP